MNIESKLSINNIKKNKNRDFYTCISIVFCSMLIFMFLLVSLSIKNGISFFKHKKRNKWNNKFRV